MYTIEDIQIETLGSFYKKDKTLFRVFAPKSNSIDLVINNSHYKMHQNGYYFEIVLGGDLCLIQYHYENDLGQTFNDPFAYVSDENGSYVLDVNNFNNQTIKPNKCFDPIIYEVNVRDFSSHISFKSDNKGKFLALSEHVEKIDDYFVIGLDYLKNIGVSHIQLMPILAFDYDHSDYNWGYNPLAYNYVLKDYVKNHDDPYNYINELRDTVNCLHKENLRVTLDVVFNHVYNFLDNDVNKMLGGDFFRYKDDHSFADGTYCGNEINSENPFVRLYLLQMSKRLLKLFDIDGLRFDLMGILDYETMNLINNELKKIKDDFLVYGEGWNMGEVLSEDKRASIVNANKLPNISMFNDLYRDNMTSFICHNLEVGKAVEALNGNYLNHHQSINYVECHDGYTFFDRLMIEKGEDDLSININRAKLALSLVVLSKGIPFIHMGQEFLRSKQLVDNSYNSSLEINEIDWNRRCEYNKVCDYFKDLISFRRQYPYFNKDYEITFEDYYGLLVYKINDLKIIVNNTIYHYDYRNNNEEFNVIFNDCGKCDIKAKDYSIPPCSLVVLKDL